MNRVSLGVLICLSALILLHMGQALIGIPAFIVGIIVMNKWGGKKR